MLDVRLLIELGLAPKEAETVVYMVNSLKSSGVGYFEAPKLAQAVGIPREKIYTYMKNLERKGMVETIGGRPKSFSLKPVDEILDRLLNQRRRELEGTILELETTVREAKRSEYGSLLPRISVLKDGAQYVRAMMEIISTSNRVMIIARTSVLLLPWELDRGPRQMLERYRKSLIERARAGRTRVEYLIPFQHTREEILERAKDHPLEARRAIGALREFCTEGKHPNIAVRSVPGLPAISLILGGGRVAIGFTSEEEARTAKGVMVESGDFFNFMSSVYDLLSSHPDSVITPPMVNQLEEAVERIGRRRIDALLGEGLRGRGDGR